MDSLLEKQRSVIKFLVSEGENPSHIFQRLKKDFLINMYQVQPCTTWFLSFVKAEQVFLTGLELGQLEAVTPTMVSNDKAFVNKNRGGSLQVKHK
jgi:hypothetical protein